MFRFLANLRLLSLSTWLCVSLVVSLLATGHARSRSESVPRDASIRVLELVASPGFAVPFASNLDEAADWSLNSVNDSVAVRSVSRLASCPTLRGTSRPGSVSYLLSDAVSSDSPLSLLAKHVRLQI